jgi:hypothetical protein
MQELTKGMFGHEFDRKNARFGIGAGQMRSQQVCHNAGWYNKKGEKLGWGDLSAEDMKTILADLQDGEMFIILSEQDSFWHFVTHNGGLGSLCTTKPEESAPGVDYVAANARFILVKGQAYYACQPCEAPTTRDVGGVLMKEISRQDIEALIKAV